MNCAEVLPFIVEPGNASPEAVEHLEACETCRARAAESRRVARLVAGLPGRPGTDVASEVMARIGYGNGRPTRDKIREQMERVRAELDEIAAGVDPVEADVRPSDGEPSAAEVLRHLPSAETAYVLAAVKAAASGSRVDPDTHTTATANAHSGTGLGTAATSQELRRVRERTLRLLCDLSNGALVYAGAELMRAVYRHEADHCAQIADTLWRLRRIEQLSS